MTDIVMPQMGESLSEGTIARWFKKKGDAVALDEPLVEISTDKVDTEIPSPVAGIVDELLVQEGETVAVGSVLLRIQAGEPAVEKQDTGDEPVSAPPAGHFRSSHEPILYERPLAAAESETPPARVVGKISPVVRALIRRHEIEERELEQLTGSGEHGRITKRDIEKLLAQREMPPTSPTAPGLTPARLDLSGAGAVGSDDAWSPLPETEHGLAEPSPPAEPDAIQTPIARGDLYLELPQALIYEPQPEDRLEPLGSVRKQIARNLLSSRAATAQVTSFTECNVHRLVRHIEEHGEEFETKEGYALTLTPFVADAVVRGLKQFPIFNAAVVGDDIAYRKHVHLGVALALEQGLLAPVLQHADELSFVGLARSLNRITRRALQIGGVDDEPTEADVNPSFTLTTPGLFGGAMGTPMLTAPQVGIMALGSVAKKPVVVDDAIAVRPIMMIALSFDHRIIDGITAYQFIEWVRVHIEQFDLS